MSTPPLILASGSPYRIERLKQAGLKVQSHPADIDETPQPNEPPQQLAERLAKTKAETVVALHNVGLVIGCDQVAAVTTADKTGLLGKPLSAEKAKDQLKLCSGRLVKFYTAICVINAATGITHAAVEQVNVQFSRLSDHQIKHYIEMDNPLDCAGSFKMEKAGIWLFDSISTRDPNALLGIPLIALKEILATFEVDVLAADETENTQ